MEWAFYPVKGVEELSALMEFFFNIDGERTVSEARGTLFIQDHGPIRVRRDSSDWLEGVNPLFEEFDSHHSTRLSSSGCPFDDLRFQGGRTTR